MTLRVRLLSLTLLMIAIVALTLIALSSDSLAFTSVDAAFTSSDYAARQVRSFIQRRLSEAPPAHSTVAETKQFWREEVAHDADLEALLEQTMAQSRSIVEIDVGGEDG